MKVPYNYLPRQFDAAEIEAILGKLRTLATSGDFTIGAPVLEFERRFAAMLGVRHVIGTNTGTDALILALKALRIGQGDEVVVQANTFYASVGAIVAVGARPAFVDCDEQYAIDHRKIESTLTGKTRAIMAVWWTGVPPEFSALLDIARRRSLSVIEDACPATGGAYDGKPAGSIGKIACFSMHPLKPLHVWGDGGAVATSDDKAGEWLRLYRNHGMTSRDEILFWGVNQRLQSVQAVVANHILDRVGSWVDRRIEIARRLDAGLEGVPEIVLPPRPANRRNTFTLYIVCVQRRDALMRFLNDAGIEAKVHYPIPLHLQPAARDLGYAKGDFPVAERQAGEIVTLPGHQFLTDAEVDYTIETVRKFYRR